MAPSKERHSIKATADMIKRIAAILLVILTVTLSGCVATATAGLKGYVDTTDGYKFLYPNGWVETKVNNGPDVVFRDLIQETENVSVVINPMPANKTLADLGTPSEVGYKLSKSSLGPPNSGREAELVNAEQKQVGDKTYYILEHTIKLPTQQRHNLASVAIGRGKLYTLSASATEERWPKVQQLFEQVVNSFSLD